MSNEIIVTIDGKEVVSAKVSSLDNLTALLMADPRYGQVTITVPGQSFQMSPNSDPITGPPTLKTEPVSNPIDALKAWFTETFASKIAAADAKALLDAKAIASAHVTLPATTIS
jgi:hypothetical protein